MKQLLLLAALLGLAPRAEAQAPWAPTNGPVLGQPIRSLLAYGDALLAGTQQDGIYRTDDGGQTWTQILDITGSAAPVLTIVAPAPGVLLAAIGTEGVYRSADGGQTWAPSNTGLPAPPGLFAAVLAVSDRYVLVGTSDGVYASEDLGQRWDPTTLSVSGWDALSLATEGSYAYTYVYATFPNTGFWRSADGGRTWTYPFSLNTADVVTLAARSATVLAGGLFSVFRSPNRGDVFGGVSGLPPGSGGYAFSFDPGRDAFVGHIEGVHRSTDDGGTWTPFSDGLPPGLPPHPYTPVNALTFLDGYLYAGTEEDGVWRRLVGPLTVAAAPVDPPVVIGPGGGSFPFTVTLTNVTDQPQTFQAWTSVAGPAARERVLGPVSVTLPPGGAVTRTLTQRVPANAPAGTYTYAANVGTFGGAVLASDGFSLEKEAGAPGAPAGAGWTVSGWDEPAASASSLLEGFALSASPNPFTSRTLLTLAVAEAQAVRVEVFDGLGRRVAVLLDGAAEAGATPLVLDGAGLPAGVYAVRVTGETFSAARRLTLVR